MFLEFILIVVNCIVECNNGGICYESDRCYCFYGFIGDMCEILDSNNIIIFYFFIYYEN